MFFGVRVDLDIKLRASWIISGSSAYIESFIGILMMRIRKIGY